jgi:uncharacterized membrane protein
MIPTSTLSPAAGRFDSLDALRGAALFGMFGYHLVWDLALVGFLRPTAPLEPGWTALARVTAGSFLFLAGASLTLAAARGLAPGPYLRRLGLVSGAAGAITAATYLAMPDVYVFFGILHHIAVASVLGLLFVRAPIWLTGAAAAAVFAAPRFVASPSLDGSWLRLLGLGATEPASVDFVPLFPWFAAPLLGIAAARMLLVARPDGAWTRWRARGRAARALVWMGRRSLWIYLLHQPLFLAVLLALAAVLRG